MARWYHEHTLFWNDYERVMLPYSAEEVQATDGETVVDKSMLSSAQRVPTAYLILGKYRVAPFQPNLGMESSQWNNRVFAFCGDLSGGAITTVEVDPYILDVTQDSEIRVSTVHRGNVRRRRGT